MYYRDYQDFENIKKQYNHERVMDEITRAKIHKAEVEENLDKFINECWKQVEVIEKTTITRYVYYRRRTEYGTNHVKYEVGLMNSPDIENGFWYEWSEPGVGKVFGGKEKKAAREYAEELAIKYNCEIRE